MIEGAALSTVVVGILTVNQRREHGGNVMDVQCGMCDVTITESTVPVKGAICPECQDYTMGYLYPVPVMASPEMSDNQVCTDYERWTKQRTTNTKKQRVERRKHDRP